MSDNYSGEIENIQYNTVLVPYSVFHVSKNLRPLQLAIESEIMDRFWHSRCLNNCIDFLYMIESFASGANASLVAVNGTKEIILLLSIKSSPVNRFQSLRCLNDHIDFHYMMGSPACGATNSLVAKIGTNDSATSC